VIKYLTAGESHGLYLTGIMDGFPYGVPVTKEFVSAQLFRRRTAPGRSARQAAEKEDFEITGGLYNGLTTGAPVSVLIRNAVTGMPEESAVPRPGHADLGGMYKYGIFNAALVRERASARETAARCALGAFCLRLCELLGVSVTSEVRDLGKLQGVTEEAAEEELKRVTSLGDTAGGVFELRINGLPAGLGSYSQGRRRLSAGIAHELYAINAVKGVEIGDGFRLAGAYGSEIDDGREGGLDGGLTSGKPVTVRCAVKPVPGLAKGALSRHFVTGAEEVVFSKTSDTTAVYAAAVIAENVVSFALVDSLLEKFGGDSLDEIKERVDSWRRKTDV